MTSPTAVPGRSVHVEPCMGTVFSIDIRDDAEPAAAVAEDVAWLHHVDAVFSTYRPDSDVSRLQRRELRLADADPDVAAVLDLCATARTDTEGWFTPLWSGVIDPTGLVKGWAVERASWLLADKGFAHHCVNGGGDVRVRGSAGAQPWRIGVVDPRERTRTVTTVSLTDGAVATSGTAERGHHIHHPFDRLPVAGPLLSATVVGQSLTFADAYATAAFARGDAAFDWIDTVDGYELLTVDRTGRRRASVGWPRGVRPGSTPHSR